MNNPSAANGVHLIGSNSPAAMAANNPGGGLAGLQQQQQQLQQQYSLPGVLHYLQIEWRRFERERNEWEIERADLKSRVTFLEGERRGLENLKTDLLRRVKMLEYALRQERNKFLALQQQQQPLQGGETATSDSPSPPAVATTTTSTEDSNQPPLQPATEQSQNPPSLVKQGSQTGTNVLSPNPIPGAPFGTATTGGGGQSGTLLNYSKGFGQARSREILKNYLREAGYLLATTSAIGSSNYNGPSHTSFSAPARSNILTSFRTDSPQNEDNAIAVELKRERDLSASSLASHASSSTVVGVGNEHAVGKRKPDGISAEEVGSTVEVNGTAGGFAKSSLEDLSLTDDDVDDAGAKGYKSERIWKPKATLLSHLESVRALRFHPSELALFSGSEDGTTKLWSLSAFAPALPSAGSKKRSNAGAVIATDLEPMYTFRGHTSAVTAVDISASSDIASGDIVYTASLDGSVRAWSVPDLRSETYSKYESKKLHTYVGHSDAVWDVKANPLPSQYPLVATGSADGTARLWERSGSFGLRGVLRDESANSMTPAAVVSVSWVHTELSRLGVGCANGKVVVYDAATMQVVTTLDAAETFDGTAATQLNKIACHPTMPLIITGHEDRYIRFFDLNSGKRTHGFTGHQDGVSCLDISPNGSTLVTGGHDCSMRWWDIGTKSCLQEYTAHRRKSDEGMWAVAYHPTVDLMGSGGADAAVKVYVYSNAD